MMHIDKSRITSSKLPPSVTITGYVLADVQKKLMHIGKRTVPDDRKLYFYSILPYLIFRIIAAENETDSMVMPSWLRLVVERMSRPENFIDGLPRMLELSNLSQEHFTREFKKYMMTTPTKFINTKRMDYAASLLLSEKYDITDVCYMCGFNNLSHFYHVFKKQYECSPKKFVKQHT